jgi:P-type Cu+ transporter
MDLPVQPDSRIFTSGMPRKKDLTLRIDGMHCAGCVRSVEQGLGSLSGVTACRVNLALRSAQVTFDPSRVTVDDLIGKVGDLGFKASPGTPDILASNRTEEARARRAFLISLIGAVPLMLMAMWPMLAGRPVVSALVDGLIEGLLAAAVLLYAGRDILADAWRQAVRFSANMNSLIALGTLTAFGWSIFALIQLSAGISEPLYFDSAGMIVVFILLGRMLEARARRQAGGAIEALLNLRPVMATALINGVDVRMEAAAAQPGMTLIVRPGERVPADGRVVDGTPVTDESLLTGESMPVEKKLGDVVIGGSLNGNSPFRMEVTTSAADSFLSSIIKLVGEAQARKAPVQRLADRVAGVFVPAVLVIAVVTGVVWYLAAPESPMLVRSVVSVLIVACPCALGLATPAAVLAGCGRGAREGIIFRGGDVLETLSKVNVVVFDKTGTLTKGALEVVEVKTFGGISEQSLIRVVGSVEMQSEHPVGVAIARYMRDRQISPTVVKHVEALPGYGVVAELEGRPLVVGNPALIEARNISFGPSLMQSDREMEKGETVVFAAMDGRVVGTISLADQVRGDARELVADLQQSMQRVTMLSGDNRKTAAGVAAALGLDDFEAEVQPSQKQLLVHSFRRAGFTVAMIGDGINDAPALAAADVGVAIGSGADVAMEAADVVLVRSELAAVSRMFSLSRWTLRTIRQNLFWAFFYNLVAIPVAAGLLYPAFGLALSPMIAALAMSLSSVFVVTNSLRLNRIRL